MGELNVFFRKYIYKMESEIQKLINQFVEIKHTILQIIETTSVIKQKLTHLKEIYVNLIKHNSKKIFLICLESFHFQYKVMNVEIENIHKHFLLLTNHTYCDYSNLYSILHKTFAEREITVSTEKQHPVYKDVDPFSEYKIEEIELVYNNSIELISFLISRFRENEEVVNKYVSKSQSGFQISNFINTLEYENHVLKDQITLYLNYCTFFQSSQTKYFSKLFNKVTTLHEEINAEIVFHETPWDKVSINETDTLVQDVKEKPAVKQWSHANDEDMVGISKEEIGDI